MPTPDVFAAKVAPLQARRLPVRAVSLRITARFERKRGFCSARCQRPLPERLRVQRACRQD